MGPRKSVLVWGLPLFGAAALACSSSSHHAGGGSGGSGGSDDCRLFGTMCNGKCLTEVGDEADGCTLVEPDYAQSLVLENGVLYVATNDEIQSIELASGRVRTLVAD